MKRLTLAFAATLFLLAAAAPTATAKDNWVSVRSENFFLIGNAGEKEVRRVATRLEQFREAFTLIFPAAKFNSPVPTTVVVFKSHSSYKPFKPVVEGRVSEVAGYFQPGEAINYITLTTEAGGGNAFETIYHEYVHLLVNNSYGKGNIPPWFNEGLAEYYSTFEIDDDRKVQLGKLIDSHLFLLRRQPLIPLSTLFAVDNSSLHRNGREAKGLFYAQSWALIHYLLLGEGGRRVPQLGRFLALVSKNAPTEQAFNETFQTDFASMEKELKKYVEGHSFRGQVATFERKLEFDSTMQSAPLAEAEADAHLGDLLLHTDRVDDAAERLQRAVALDPKLAAAHASLGLARARQKRYADARRHLRDALTADPQSYRAHYYYAYAVSREGMDETGVSTGYSPAAALEMRESLQKAAELKPDFPGTYHLQAWVNLVTGERLGEGVEFIKKALKLSPGNEQYAFILAQIYIAQQYFEAARRVAEPLAKHGSDPQLRANAQSLLHSIKMMREQAEQLKAAREAAERGGGEPPRLRRPDENRTATAADAPAAAVSSGKSEDELVADALAEAIRGALRQPEAGDTRARGVLTRIECGPKGFFFHVTVDGRVLKLRADNFNGLHLTAYTREAGGQVACGERKPESHVVVTYRDASAARTKSDGALVAVEFVPADFRLKP